GSIAYSAVAQPLPLPVSQRGTPVVEDAVHSTFVPPKLISAEPSAFALQPRSIVISRSWSVARPSARTMSDMSFLRVGGPGLRRVREFGKLGEVRQGDHTRLDAVHIAHLSTHESVRQRGELRGGCSGRLVGVARGSVGRREQVAAHELSVDVAGGLIIAGYQGDAIAH